MIIMNVKVVLIVKSYKSFCCLSKIFVFYRSFVIRFVLAQATRLIRHLAPVWGTPLKLATGELIAVTTKSLAAGQSRRVARRALMTRFEAFVVV